MPSETARQHEEVRQVEERQRRAEQSPVQLEDGHGQERVRNAAQRGGAGGDPGTHEQSPIAPRESAQRLGQRGPGGRDAAGVAVRAEPSPAPSRQTVPPTVQDELYQRVTRYLSLDGFSSHRVRFVS